MPSKILDGKALAQLAEEDIKSHVSTLKENGITPTLATILVGVDPASATYVKMKQNACARLGMDSIAVELSKETTTEELLEAIEKLNNDSNVHGILLQHPVPSQINERKCFDAIDVTKDVDGNTIKILENEKGEIIIPDNLGWDFLTEYDETPQEKVDNVLTKVFNPIQSVVGKVTSWFKWHLWEKWMERKKREDLIEKGIRG